MPIKVRIPTPLRKLTHDEEIVQVTAATVGGAIAELQSRYPGIKERLTDEGGSVRRFVNVFLDEEDVRFLDGLATPIAAGQTLSIVPAVAGG